MSSARVRLPPELKGLLRSQLEDCIEQANLGVEDTWIVRRYLIARVPQADLAAELGCSRKTIFAHISRSIPSLQQAALKIAGT